MIGKLDPNAKLGRSRLKASFTIILTCDLKLSLWNLTTLLRGYSYRYNAVNDMRLVPVNNFCGPLILFSQFQKIEPCNWCDHEGHGIEVILGKYKRNLRQNLGMRTIAVLRSSFESFTLWLRDD